MAKNPIIPFILSFFIPGLGHLYVGRRIRPLLYGGSFFGPAALAFLIFVSSPWDDEIVFALLLLAAFFWFVNMADMTLTLMSRGAGRPSGRSFPYDLGEPAEAAVDTSDVHYLYRDRAMRHEKMQTIALAFIPGLGHLSLGMMQRGLTFLVSFVGLLTMIVFVTWLTNTEAFLAFQLVLPVMWIYSLFDAVNALHRRQRGEPVEDRSVFAELEHQMESGRRSKMLAAAMAMFPGAGHLYLGLQRRGLQLMGGFLLTVYLLDALRLSLFLFLLPLFWFYAFFDALQQVGRYGREPLRDEPVVSQLVPHQRWIGIAMLGLGCYYFFDRIVAELLPQWMPEWRNDLYRTRHYMPTAVVSFLLIAGGIRLMAGPRRAAAPERKEDAE